MIFLLSMISGVLCSLPFIDPSFFLLAWFSLVPFLYSVLKATSAKDALVSGCIFGIFFFGPVLFWITELRHFVHFWAYLAWAALVIFQSVFTALFAYLLFRGRTSSAVFYPAALWTALEWIRSFGPFGVTGGGLGYSQAFFIPLIQVSSITGVWGVSFLIVAANAWISAYFARSGTLTCRMRSLSPACLALIVLFSAVLLFGAARMRTFSPDTQDHGIKAALIQANIPQKDKLDFGLTRRIFDDHLKLSQDAALRRPDIIIWPETAVTDYLLENRPMLSMLKDFAVEHNVSVVVGASYFTPARDAHNSLFSFSPDGELIGRYDKIHLVPFGEYIPLRPLFYPILRFSGDLFERDFTSGASVRLLPAADTLFAATICFESTFPSLVRGRVRRGGEIILVATNDAWFGASPAAAQHFYSGVFRAVENGAYLVQAANSGISGLIDPAGRVVANSNVDEKAVMIVEAKRRTGTTFYTRAGDVFAFLCALAALVVLAASRRQRV